MSDKRANITFIEKVRRIRKAIPKVNFSYILKQYKHLSYIEFGFKYNIDYFLKTSTSTKQNLLTSMHILQEVHWNIRHFSFDILLLKKVWNWRNAEWKTGRHVGFDKYSILFGKNENKNIHTIETVIILVIKP